MAGIIRNPPPGPPIALPSSRISQILQTIDLRDPAQATELLALVYDDLRAVAARHLQREQAGHTLQPTALVHEAYLRLIGGSALALEGRQHFFRVAARAMRQVLVDAARHRNAAKRGGALPHITVPELAAELPVNVQFLDLHDALERLEALHPRLVHLVEMRFFTGLTLDEAADALGVSRRKAAKDWSVARLWLQRELAA
jgi:RNA polymerase sigma factor (TIGR02999 family)